MVVLLVGELGNSLDESVGFLEVSELEALLHVVEVLCCFPAVVATSVHNVCDNVLVHLRQLSLAVLVELNV